MKSTDFKICDVIIGINTINIKLGQIFIYCMTNISNIFLIQRWRLETSSGPLMILLQLHNSNIWAFFPFLNVLYSPFQKNQKLET